MNSLEDLWSWAESHTNLEKKPDPSKRSYRLDRMHYLLKVLDNPQDRVPVLHIAGSKGKGSTATYLSHILSSKGKKVGLYRSPHILDYRERITMNSEFFPDRVYLENGLILRNVLEENTAELERLGGPATTFEILTLLAFLIFFRTGMDYQVLETGLGGRLDATNCVVPLASILTRIELEHVEILGSSLSEIAREKAGIIKNAVPVFTASQDPSALRVFLDTARSHDATLFEFEKDVLLEGPQNERFTLNWPEAGLTISIPQPIPSTIQCYNYLYAFYILRKLEFVKTEDFRSLWEQLRTLQVPGRFQVWGNRVVLDGAHTKESVKTTADGFWKLFGRSGILVFGAFEDKNVLGMADILKQGFSQIFLCPPGFIRPSNLDLLAQAFSDHPGIKVFPTPHEAFETALRLKQPTLICGSFYLVGEFLKNEADLKQQI